MACRFEITLASEDARFVPAARAALDEVDLLEAALTVFRDSSELSEINRRGASGPLPVSRALMNLLSLCRDLHSATGGAFDATSAPLSRAWGFLAGPGRQPSAEQIEAALARTGMNRVVLDEKHRTIRFTTPGVELSLGGIGKGWALDQIAVGLRRRGLRRGFVGAGGSSFFGWGGEDWHVTLRPGGEPLADLQLHEAALGTSGTEQRHLEIEGRRFGHVIDPRTGRPAGGVTSASVIVGNAAAADALATAFVVGGTALASSYCAEHPGTVALLVLEDDPRTLIAYGSRDRLRVEPASDVGLRTETEES
jgi:thiamine biosynthesis lipoprotein